MRSFFIVSALVMGTLAGMVLCGVRVNLTGSMPIGIYVPSQDQTYHRNDWVAVCLPKLLSTQGLQNGYLMAGNCQDTNAMPVLKQLIALPGDTVEVTPTSIIVNEKSYPAKIQTQDHRGHLIKIQSKLGVKTIINNYWLYGSASDRSWDSRYYGGVERTNIIGIYRPFLVF